MNISMRDIFDMITEATGIKVHYGKQFKKNLKKTMRSPIAAKKLPAALKEIETTGKSTIGGTHVIAHAPKFTSELTGDTTNNWVVVPISRKEEIRILYKFHPELETVEILNVGAPNMIGYKH